MAKRSGTKRRWRKDKIGPAWSSCDGRVVHYFIGSAVRYHWTTRFLGEGPEVRAEVRAEGYADTLDSAKAACERWAETVARESKKEATP